MKMKWTKPQQEVIDNRDSNLLVSAAAGSGKTAVLVEHIIKQVLDDENPVDIDSLMVVTFTSAAAGEMRERILAAIEKAIEENPDNRHLQRQMSYIHNAKITTLHSFCLNIVRDHFDIPDIDPGFRIGDNGEIDMMKSDVVKEVMEEYYQSEREDFHQLVEQLTQKNSDKELEEYILSFYENACSNVEPEQWMKQMASYYGDDADRSMYDQIIREHINGILEECVSDYELALSYTDDINGPVSCRDKLEAEYEAVKEAYEEDDFEEKCQKVINIEFPVMRMSKKDGSTEEMRVFVKNIRDEAKGYINSLKSGYCRVNQEKNDELIIKLKGAVSVFVEVTLRFMECYADKKREKNVLDFNDIEHMALGILTVMKEGKTEASPIADEIAETISEVIVDEYQDINQVQDTILRCLSSERFGKPNMFMVGDVKQSIYGFRKADPELFMYKYDTYKEQGKDRKIILDRNFRSRTGVIDSINFLFRKIMYREMGGIDYEGENELYPGADYPTLPDGQDGLTELLIAGDVKELENEKSDDGEFLGITKKQAEARMTAIRIREMTDKNNGYKVYDRKTGEYRTAEYSDILILLRSVKANAQIYMDELMAAGIPVYFEQQTGYFDTVEVNEMLSLLNIIDNPHQDIHMAASLKSPFGMINDTELAMIRGSSDERTDLYNDVKKYMECGTSEKLVAKLEAFDDRLNKYRKMAVYTSIHDLITFIIEDTSYDSYVKAMPAGDRRSANILMLKEKALEYENGSYRGLFNFVRYIEKIRKYEVESGEASTVSENDNIVRIMSIHKSKGLEYPIVFLCNSNGKFNDMDTKKAMVIHKKYGIGLDYINPDTRVRYKSYFKDSIKMAFKREAIEEEIRVLYVALTRAKEKLIITASGVNTDKFAYTDCKKHLNKQKILNSGSYMDLIGYAMGRDILTGNDVISVRYIDAISLIEKEMKKQISGLNDKLVFKNWDGDYVYSEQSREKLKQIMQYEYPFKSSVVQYAKVSVSDVKHKAMEEDEEIKNIITHGEEKKIVPEFILSERNEKQEKLTGALRGTAYHRIFELYDFDMECNEENVRNFMKRLLDDGKIDDGIYNTVKIQDIITFANSSLGVRMKNAWSDKKLYREAQFVMGIDGKKVYDEGGEDVLIQGIIDVYFVEDGEIVLADYKTDRVDSADKLIDMYKIQLELYKDALEQITGKKVKEVIIYSVTLSEVINVV